MAVGGPVDLDLNEDLAYSLGMNPRRERMALTLVLAICVAVAIKIVARCLSGRC
ncbi:MAG: hypothetical protein R3D60_05815 [Paracoccaceae bacterium]